MQLSFCLDIDTSSSTGEFREAVSKCFSSHVPSDKRGLAKILLHIFSVIRIYLSIFLCCSFSQDSQVNCMDDALKTVFFFCLCPISNCELTHMYKFVFVIFKGMFF